MVACLRPHQRVIRGCNQEMSDTVTSYAYYNHRITFGGGRRTACQYIKKKKENQYSPNIKKTKENQHSPARTFINRASQRLKYFIKEHIHTK
jgi:hypothetical protein